MRVSPEPRTTRNAPDKQVIANVPDDKAGDSVLTPDDLVLAQQVAMENRARSIAISKALTGVLEGSIGVMRAISRSASLVDGDSWESDVARTDAATAAKNAFSSAKEVLEGLKSPLRVTDECTQDFVTRVREGVIAPTEEIIGLAIRLEIAVRSKHQQDVAGIVKQLKESILSTRKSADLLVWEIRKFYVSQKGKLLSERLFSEAASRRGIATMTLLTVLGIAAVELVHPGKGKESGHPVLTMPAKGEMPMAPEKPTASASASSPTVSKEQEKPVSPDPKGKNGGESKVLPDPDESKNPSAVLVASSDPQKRKEYVSSLMQQLREFSRQSAEKSKNRNNK